MNKITRSLLLIACVFLLASCKLPDSTSTSSTACKLNLQVYVHQGPNADYTISGQVALGSASWSNFEGNFVEENGSSHHISLNFDGQAVHFILDVDKGPIYGVGAMENSLDICSGNGGGTLSGPALGDMGDWRGGWLRETGPVPQEQPRSNPLTIYLCTGISIVILAILAVAYFKLFTPFKKTSSPQSKAASSALQKTVQDVSAAAGESGTPLAEYTVTYTAEDNLFDLSFQIEKSGQYLGECGITIAKSADNLSNQAMALDVWLFDARDIQTVSKILMSDFCYRQETLRSEMEKKGQTILIQPEEMVVLLTKELRAKAKILQVEYDSTQSIPNSLFKKVVIKIEVWKNAN
jgi:hypothetical protein